MKWIEVLEGVLGKPGFILQMNSRIKFGPESLLNIANNQNVHM
jgi:hypothetical protein